MKRERSLQQLITRHILLITAAIMVLGGLFSAVLTFNEARELQDSLLKELATLVKKGNLSSVKMLNSENSDIHIRIQAIDTIANKESPPLPKKLTNGVQTLVLEGEPWRAVVATKNGQRFLVAQPTEIRDDLAFASGLTVLIPLLTLGVFMLLLIRWAINRQFSPLRPLIKDVKKQQVSQLESLPTENLPSEISPFVAAINELHIRIRKTLDEQQRFIADASHELKTPLTALSLIAENIENAPTKKDRLERQYQLKESLERMQKMLNQLLDLARLQSGQQTPKNPIRVDKIVQQVVADIIPLAYQDKIDLGVTRLDEVSVLDQDNRLQQLIFNAIDNAVRYSPKGGQVNVRLYKQKNNAIFQVDNEGEKISEKELHQFFKPFYRSQENTKPGNGLGLAICEEISIRLGGTLNIKNLEKGGLLFTYTQGLYSTKT